MQSLKIRLSQGGTMKVKIAILLGRNVKRLRIKHGLSAIDLAVCCGVNRNSVYAIERGSQWPGAQLLEALAFALGVNPSELIA